MRRRDVGGARALLAIDTNIVVRIIVVDDLRQALRAREVIETSDVTVSATVLLESEWVLRSVYRRSREEIVRSLRAFVRLPHAFVENHVAVMEALAWAEAGMDFADALHLAGASEAEAFLSFDRDLARDAKKFAAVPVREP
jgi:predicted nucleic-acid-binding protein